ncbi:MAG: TadE/TadG family type IV pilus assembly protein [Geminicoccaceae bacterium]
MRARLHRADLETARRRLGDRLGRFAADRRGATALTVGLLSPVLLAVAGLSVDVGTWLVDRQRLQQAADMAALAGVQAALAGADAAGVTAAASELAARNGFTAGEGNVLRVTLGGTAARPWVQVTASRSARRWFPSLLVSGDVPIRARSVAAASGPGEAICVLGLDEEEPATVDLRGRPEPIANCGIASNSVNLASSTVIGSAELRAPFVQVEGLLEIVGAASIVSPDLRSGVAPIVDPHGPEGRDLQPPTGGGCAKTGSA